MFQCYYRNKEGRRCKNRQDTCWCSDIHKKLEQEERYGRNLPASKRQLTVEELKQGFIEMGKRASINAKMENSGQVKILPEEELNIQNQQRMINLDH